MEVDQWGGDPSNCSEVLTLVADVIQLFLGDDLRFTDRRDRATGWRPYEPPGS